MRRAFIGRRTDGVGAKRTTPDDLIAVQPSRLSQSRNCFGRFASGQQGDFEAAQRVIAAPQYLACAKPGSGRMTGKREVPVKIRQSSGLPASTARNAGIGGSDAQESRQGHRIGICPADCRTWRRRACQGPRIWVLESCSSRAAASATRISLEQRSC